MAAIYLHSHPEFLQLLQIAGNEMNILPALVEKDYWVMHVLYGLQQQGFHFELKGGTSLSKGYKIIDRFSEDIDIHIKPPAHLAVEERPNKTKQQHNNSRKNFYDWLSKEIKIDGIVSITRDTAFDTDHYRSGGVRLLYQTHTEIAKGIKEGILLEAGFDTVTPNTKLTVSSWAYDKATTFKDIELIDNRAVDIACYNAGYTLVEKLQAIATKFRKEQEHGGEYSNYLRQYYDVYSLLSNKDVLNFIGTDEYYNHKKNRFPAADRKIPLKENEAFLLSDPKIRERLRSRYKLTANLYYRGQPPFEDLLSRIFEHIDKL